ncbi:MAG: hypothetical protein EWM72_02766 [Nitrospira sp.]|nr:MAG: hypothetical protein EWM72_02766 [Nitrospira sp.]
MANALFGSTLDLRTLFFKILDSLAKQCGVIPKLGYANVTRGAEDATDLTRHVAVVNIPLCYAPASGRLHCSTDRASVPLGNEERLKILLCHAVYALQNVLPPVSRVGSVPVLHIARCRTEFRVPTQVFNIFAAIKARVTQARDALNSSLWSSNFIKTIAAPTFTLGYNRGIELGASFLFFTTSAKRHGQNITWRMANEQLSF